MIFKKSLQLPEARRTRVWHHHGSDTATSPWAILLHTDQFYVHFAHDCKYKYLRERTYIYDVRRF